jgi:hypothetical protein
MAGVMERNNSLSPVAHLQRTPKPYVPHDVIGETSKTAIVAFGSGLFIASIRNAMDRRNVGALGIFTRGAPIIGLASTLPYLCNWLVFSWLWCGFGGWEGGLFAGMAC